MLKGTEDSILCRKLSTRQDLHMMTMVPRCTSPISVNKVNMVNQDQSLRIEYKFKHTLKWHVVAVLLNQWSKKAMLGSTSSSPSRSPKLTKLQSWFWSHPPGNCWQRHYNGLYDAFIIPKVLRKRSEKNQASHIYCHGITCALSV